MGPVLLPRAVNSGFCHQPLTTNTQLCLCMETLLPAPAHISTGKRAPRLQSYRFGTQLLGERSQARAVSAQAAQGRSPLALARLNKQERSDCMPVRPRPALLVFRLQWTSHRVSTLLLNTENSSSYPWPTIRTGLSLFWGM